MNVHISSPAVSANDMARIYSSRIPPVIFYNQRFKKTLRYQETIFWPELKRYVGVYIATGTWEGRYFSQRFLYRWNGGRLVLVREMQAEFFG